MSPRYEIKPKSLPPVVSADKARELVDVFIPGLLRRAGMTVKVTKTKNGRTLQIKLPK